MQRFQFINIKIFARNKHRTPPADVPPLAARAVLFQLFAQTHPQRRNTVPPE